MSASIDIAHLMGLCETAIHNANMAENGTNENTVKLNATESNISTTYTPDLHLKGECVIYNDILWECLSSTTNEPKEGAEWKKTSVAEMIVELSKRIAELETIKEV